MPLDLDALKRHYASLSDDALLTIARDELVEVARTAYDAEAESRGLIFEDAPIEEIEVADEAELAFESNTADWEGDPALVGRFLLASEVSDAIQKLEDAGIPTHLIRAKAEEDPRRAFSLYTPDTQSERAMRLLYDEQKAGDYEAHFAEISDEELLAVDPSALPAVARKMHATELAKRGHEAPIAESAAAAEGPEGMECVGTFVTREQAAFAQSILKDNAIEAALVDSEPDPDDVDTASFALWTTPADYDKACELLESQVEDILTHA